MVKSAQTHGFPHVITPAVIMILQRVRVKAGSAGAMEMNGRVNREVDWGAEAPRVARAAIFSPPHFSALRAERRVICLAVKLVIAPPSIIG